MPLQTTTKDSLAHPTWPDKAWLTRFCESIQQQYPDRVRHRGRRLNYAYLIRCYRLLIAARRLEGSSRG